MGRTRSGGWLTPQIIFEIKKALWEGQKQVEVAMKFGVSQPTVSHIYNGYKGFHCPWPSGETGAFPIGRKEELALEFSKTPYKDLMTQLNASQETKELARKVLETMQADEEKKREAEVFPDLEAIRAASQKAEAESLPPEESSSEEGSDILDMPYFTVDELRTNYSDSIVLHDLYQSYDELTFRAAGIIMKVNPKANPDVVIPRNLPIILSGLKKAIDKGSNGV